MRRRRQRRRRPAGRFSVRASFCADQGHARGGVGGWSVKREEEESDRSKETDGRRRSDCFFLTLAMAAPVARLLASSGCVMPARSVSSL